MIWIIVLAAVAFAVFLFLCCASLHPAFQSMGSPSEIIEKRGVSGKDATGKKILVAYCTRHGSTASIAEKIGDTLGDKGFSVDVLPIQKVTRDTLSEYDGYVIGSGVIWSKLMPNFQDFLKEHESMWQKKPTALFAVCLTIQRDIEANRERVKNYIADSIKHVPEFNPFERVAFAGAVDMKKLTFYESFALNLFFMVTPQQGGDHRDMSKVAQWAEKVSAGLSS